MENCTQYDMIRQRRETLGISLTALASRLDMHRNMLAEIETGKRAVRPHEILPLLVGLELIDEGKTYSLDELVRAARGIFSRKDLALAIDHTMALAA